MVGVGGNSLQGVAQAVTSTALAWTQVAAVIETARLKAKRDIAEANTTAEINAILSDTKTSKYWVEADGQHTDLNMQLKPEDITFTRDGNHQISADVSYTQQMFVPLLKKTQVLTYSFHVEGPAR